jgi:hypothetical protein
MADQNRADGPLDHSQNNPLHGSSWRVLLKASSLQRVLQVDGVFSQFFQSLIPARHYAYPMKKDMLAEYAGVQGFDGDRRNPAHGWSWRNCSGFAIRLGVKSLKVTDSPGALVELLSQGSSRQINSAPVRTRWDDRLVFGDGAGAKDPTCFGSTYPISPL